MAVQAPQLMLHLLTKLETVKVNSIGHGVRAAPVDPERVGIWVALRMKDI